jgi:hypothetical protein
VFAVTGRTRDVHEAGYAKNCPSQILLQIALYANLEYFMCITYK